MKKFTFYIGFHSLDLETKEEFIFKEQKFCDDQHAYKLLRALREIFLYLTQGISND